MPYSSIVGSDVNNFRNGLNTKIQINVNNRPCINDKKIPREAVLSAFFLSLDPRKKEATELIPIPCPTAIAVTTSCKGYTKDIAVIDCSEIFATK